MIDLPRTHEPRTARGPVPGRSCAHSFAALLLAALSSLQALAGGSSPAAPAARDADEPAGLAFRIDEGRNVNAFVRRGPAAAHLVLRSGAAPRILVAFPAGNSGVGLWFEDTERPVAWELVSEPRPVTLPDERGRPLHGIEAQIEVDAPSLDIRAAVLSSVRVLRDYEALGKAPREVLIDPAVADKRITWSRDRLDGAAGYRLSLLVQSGASVEARRIVASQGERRLRLDLVALTGETPLTSMSPQSLLTPQARGDARARNALGFLSYDEKFLAGSWRFDTYFGRDTLISLALLAPVLQPDAMASGLASVLARLAPNGEAAHEEDIGEFAILRNQQEGRGRVDTPIYDYGMIDDDFLLAPVAAGWLLDARTGRAQAVRFLTQTAGGRERNGAALVRNLVWLVERASGFAAAPRTANLVGIKPGRNTGQWRDSEQGLAGGRYAYDVNAVFVPAALRATADLLDSGILDPHLSASQRSTLARARAHAAVWTDKAPDFFVTTIPVDQARSRVDAYAADVGVDAGRARAALGDAPVKFDALALDATGKPIPVLHSDEGFRLLLADPAPDEVALAIDASLRPFPAGLMTDVGLLVANPVFAGRDIQREFTRSAYHGTVVWSWQQAVLAAGLERQLRRTDLPVSLRSRLVAARSQLWRAIEATAAVRTSELWSWSYADGRYRVEPFGQSGTHVDESNAAQLWSTVFLGLKPPQDRHGNEPVN
jgi:glycogen debranching enzyme